MKALVTGASGFVGRHLVTHLEACGDEVVRSDRLSDGIDIIDGPRLAATVAAAQPDAVYHLAGWSDVGGSWTAERDVFHANAIGTQNVLMACVAAGVGRVLVVTSADVYGIVTEADLPLTEDAQLRPVSPYAASKVAADFLALQAHLGRGLATIRTRSFNHLGPGQKEHFVASGLAGRIARNERDGGEVVPVGDLSPRRDFTDVRDVVRAYRLLVLQGTPGEVYNICSGRDIAIRDLAERLIALAARPMRLEVDADLLRPVEVPVLRGDNTRLRETTGWEPTVPIDQTLADLLSDARARLAVSAP